VVNVYNMSFGQFRKMAGAGRGNHVGRADGSLIELPGWSMRVKDSASDTAGQLTLIEATMARGHGGPAEHIHVGHGEAFFVLSGNVSGGAAGQVIRAGS
jgi:hypothetical protein